MIRQRILTCGFFTLLSLGNLVKGQDLILDPTVRKGTLPNGFQYFIKANKHPEHRAVLYLANKVGAVLEDEQERGIAHFIEHMNFKGTRHFPKNQLIDYLEKAGVRFGADLNAYTAYDETVYQLPIPTNNVELWKNGMQIMRDWASEALMNKEEFEKERGVILEEKRLQQNVSGRMRDQYSPMIYNFSRYAYRPPIGLDEVIGKADIQVLNDFYKKWYRPDLQALIVVGDINAEQVEQQIKTLFSDLKSMGEVPSRPVYPIPVIDSTRFLEVTDQEFSGHQIEILFKRKAKVVNNKESFREALVRDFTNSLIASRIKEVLQGGTKPYLGMSAGAGAFVGDLEMFDIRIALSPEKSEEGFKGAWTEIERIARYGFSSDELKDVKDRWYTQMALQEKEKDKTESAQLAENYLDYFLTGKPYISTDQRIALYAELSETIGVETILQYVRNYLAEKDRVLLVMGTDQQKNHLPNQTNLMNWMHAVRNSEIKPNQQERKTLTLLDEISTVGTVRKTHTDPEMGLTHWTLSNGAEVYAKPTAFMNDEILFTAFSKGGSSLYQDSDYYSVMNAATFMANSGLGNLNLSQLNQFLNAKAVQVIPYIADREEGFNGGSSTQDLETGLRLMHLYMTQARLDTTQFNTIMERSISAMQNRVSDPNRVFADTVGNILGNYHFRRQPSSITTVSQIKADRVALAFKERFANAGDFSFVFVGNFQLDSLKVLVEKYIGSLPSNATREIAKDLKIRVPRGTIRKDLKLGEGNKSTVQFVYSDSYQYSSQNNLCLEVLKSVIDFRLMERLRKQESGVYAPNVQLTKAKQPIGFFAFIISFECDPNRKEELIVAVRQELSKLRKEGITQEELKKFVAEQSGAFELNEKSNQFWLSYLKEQLAKKEPLHEFLKYPEFLRKIDLLNLNRKMLQLMVLDNEIIITLSPGKA